jgi:DNA-binding winged helix-turn-helix (wHTH) protein
VPRYRFGNFELNVHSGELRRNGAKMRLQDQPFLVLRKLLESAGTVVAREDLHAALWPADTFVDFDTSLNTAIKRLREVLADSADNPVFIETVPRRGYRFLARSVGRRRFADSRCTPSIQTHCCWPIRHRRCRRLASSHSFARSRATRSGLDSDYVRRNG